MSPDGSTVLFGALPAQFNFNVYDRRALISFARKLSAQLAHGKYFECLIADDVELRRLNRLFLKHDYATDVLSFPTEGQPFTIGECAISVERAHDQSQEYGHSLIREIQILMLHGVLHLLGLDHEKDAGEMAAAEKRWRTKLKLPNSLTERSRIVESAAL